MGEQLKYGGGSPILFQHLFWFFGHPEVYIVALPAFGIVSDLISTHARKNIFGYRMMVWAIVGDRRAQLRRVGAPHVCERDASVFRLLLRHHHADHRRSDRHQGLQLGADPVARRHPSHHCRCCSRSAFIVTFVNGGLTGLFLGNVVVDVPLSDTMFVVAHFHMVMGVAPILVIFGAIYHWYPKITGRMLNDDPGQVPLLGHVPRRLCDLLPDALSRSDRRAAPLSRARRDRSSFRHRRTR